MCGVGDENSGDMLTVPYIASGCRRDMGGVAGPSRLKMILKSYPELTSREIRSESRIALAAAEVVCNWKVYVQEGSCYLAKHPS